MQAPLWPDPGAGGGHCQQWRRQAGAGDGAAAVAGAVPGVWPDPEPGGGHRQPRWRQAGAGDGAAAVAGAVPAPPIP
ncbi:hypothetical protein WDV90_14270 [Xanthomonas translucens pv. undulosa]